MTVSDKPLAPTKRPERKAKTEATPPPIKKSTSKTAMIPLFVYGTLMQGFPLHSWIKDQTYVGKGQIEGYALVSLGPYPALVFTGSKSVVHGEYYLVDESVYAGLRDMEEKVGYTTLTVAGTFDDGAAKGSVFRAQAFVMWDVSKSEYFWDVEHVAGQKPAYYVNSYDPKKEI